MIHAFGFVAIMEFRNQIASAVSVVIQTLEQDEISSDMDSLTMRLESLFEAALINGDIPLAAVDLLNRARILLQETKEIQRNTFYSHKASVLIEARCSLYPRCNLCSLKVGIYFQVKINTKVNYKPQV